MFELVISLGSQLLLVVFIQWGKPATGRAATQTPTFTGDLR